MPPSEYRIIRVYGDTYELETRVTAATADGWQPSGAPFRDESARMWCQAVTRQAQRNPAGEINIREPQKGGRK